MLEAPPTRVYFTGSNNVLEFFEDFEEYLVLAKVPEDDKAKFLKYALKSDAKIWYECIATLTLGQTPTYNALKTEIIGSFSSTADKAKLTQEFYTGKMSPYDKPTAFLLRKLELIKQLELKLSFAAALEIIASLLPVEIQDYLDLRPLTSYDDVFKTLSKYQDRRPSQAKDNFIQQQENVNIQNQRRETFTPPQVNFNRPQQASYFTQPLHQPENVTRNQTNSPNTQAKSLFLNTIAISPVDLPRSNIVLHDVLMPSYYDTGAERCFLSSDIYDKYYSFKSLNSTPYKVVTAQGKSCVNRGEIFLKVKLNDLETFWPFQVIENLQYSCILGLDFIQANNIKISFGNDSLSIACTDMQVKPSKLSKNDVQLHPTAKSIYHARSSLNDKIVETSEESLFTKSDIFKNEKLSNSASANLAAEFNVESTKTELSFINESVILRSEFTSNCNDENLSNLTGDIISENESSVYFARNSQSNNYVFDLKGNESKILNEYVNPSANLHNVNNSHSAAKCNSFSKSISLESELTKRKKLKYAPFDPLFMSHKLNHTDSEDISRTGFKHGAFSSNVHLRKYKRRTGRKRDKLFVNSHFIAPQRKNKKRGNSKIPPLICQRRQQHAPPLGPPDLEQAFGNSDGVPGSNPYQEHFSPTTDLTCTDVYMPALWSA